MIEDSECDAELTIYALGKYGFHIYSERVETYNDLEKALTEKEWDVILSDNAMPQFSALAALFTRNELKPDIPFIIISGNVGSDLIALALENNCQGCFLKGNLEQLGDTILRELKTYPFSACNH